MSSASCRMLYCSCARCCIFSCTGAMVTTAAMGKTMTTLEEEKSER